MIGALRAFASRLLASFGVRRTGHDFDEELESHLQLHIDANIRAGMTPDAARRDATLRLGGIAQTRERHRDRQRLALLDEACQDLRFAARLLRKNPGFTATAVLTLALGIGANAAIFALVNAVLLRPLPYPQPDRLVMIFATNRASGNNTDVASYPDFADWSHAATFSRMGAFASRNVTVADGGNTEYLVSLRVSASLFDTLGIQPSRGRGFRGDDEQPGAAGVVILSDGFWKRHYGGTDDVLGRMLRVNEASYTVVGVMGPDVRINTGAPEDFYLPLTIDPARNHGFLRVVGRLKSGVALEAAQSELAVIAQRIAAAYPRSNANVGTHALRLVDAIAINVRTGLFVLLGVVGIVLLIACTNVASLMLARGAARQRELAIRGALGAGRGRIIRQLLAESVLLSIVSGGVGLFAGSWSARALAALLETNMHRAVPRVETTSVDLLVFGFTVVLSVVAGLVFGAAPAMSAASGDLHRALGDGSRAATSRRAPLLRRTLVVAETALAVVLLAGAGVLLQALLTMRATPPGFEPDHVVVTDVWLPQPRFAGVPARARFYTDAIARVDALPSVHSAAFVTDLPLNGDSDTLSFHIVNRPDPPAGPPVASFNIVTADYFTTMRIPVRAGRPFGADDVMNAPGAIVVSEAAARRFWPDGSPIGQQIALPQSQAVPEAHENSATPTVPPNVFTVVGVVGDVRDVALSTPPRPQIYLSSLQANLPWPWGALVVRTTGDPDALAGAIREAVRSADPNVPQLRVSTLDAVVARSIAAPRVYTILLGAFAALALLLAAIGLYGLVSYSVSQRTHEIGVRVALGAERREILRLVLAQGVGVAACGTVAGLLGAWAATRVLVGLVGAVKPTDPAAFGAVSALLIAVAIAATYVPARRAARVDPIVALRFD